jgi:diacylglycerol kinase
MDNFSLNMEQLSLNKFSVLLFNYKMLLTVCKDDFLKIFRNFDHKIFSNLLLKIHNSQFRIEFIEFAQHGEERVINAYLLVSFSFRCQKTLLGAISLRFEAEIINMVIDGCVDLKSLQLVFIKVEIEYFRLAISNDIS